MKSNEELLHCEDCEHWTFKNSIGYCTVRRETCASHFDICRLYKPKATEPETLTCMDCANYTFLDNIGRCPLQRSNPEPQTTACVLFKPKVTEPETEKEETPTAHKNLGMRISMEITITIIQLLDSKISQDSFVLKMQKWGFLSSAASILAANIMQFKEQKPKPAKYPTQAEAYGARRYDKQDFPGDTHEAYIDFGWSTLGDMVDDDA